MQAGPGALLYLRNLPMPAKKQEKQQIGDFDRSDKGTQAAPIDRKQVADIASLKNEQARKVFGFLLLVLTAVLFISFVSFFFSWKSDQDFLAGGDWKLFKANHGKVENAMGLVGARLGYFFIHNGFGMAAFALLPYIAFSGLFLLFGYRPFSLLRIAIHTILFTAWFSLTLGFIFHPWFPLMGGTFGYFGIAKLNQMIGWPGSLIFLISYAVVYVMLFLNLNPFDRIKLPSKSPEMEEAPEAENNSGAQIIEDDPDEVIEPETESDPDIIFIDEEDEIDYQPVDVAALPPIELKIKEEPPAVVTQPEPVVEQEPKPQIIELGGDENFQIEVKTDDPDEFVEENRGDTTTDHFGIDTTYDPKLELRDYRHPSLDLLNDYGSKKQEIDMDEIENSKTMIIDTLKNYNIGISKIMASVGPTVTLYEIIPAPGVKISKIKNLEDDIALSLAALGIRIIAPIPGKGTIGIEVPNKNPEMVPMKGVLASKKFQEADMQLPVALGKTISNEIFVTDLAKMPHLLMAGATGQGKSVGLNAILVSLLYKKHPAYIKFVLVDPKKVELTLYNKIERHFLAKLPGDGEAIITDNTKVINTLNSLCVEMDNRYKLLQDAMVRNIVEYNARFLERKLNPQNGHKFLPYIVVVIDEVADLMMTAGKEIETPIARIAQLARAIGIHLILATQRPSVNVITGMIKANFPARIAFRVTSKIDSRTILDANGADQLIGKGDMLYSGGNEMIRLQCPFVDTPEVERIVEFIGEQRAYSTAFILPEVKDESGEGRGNESFDPNERDDLFEDAARVVVQNQIGSTSLIQRRLKIGYSRAGRLMDQLEDAGVVGPNLGSKAREVRIPDESSLEQFLNNL
jgi:S-DNA-T family DNA segregation ATPase FtsK/SpoIIIE